MQRQVVKLSRIWGKKEVNSIDTIKYLILLREQVSDIWPPLIEEIIQTA